MSEKQAALRAIKSLPSNARIEDATERLYLLYKIQRGIQQANASQVLSQQEARKRMAKWLL